VGQAKQATKYKDDRDDDAKTKFDFINDVNHNRRLI
jgi:hypothetical protein